MSCALAACYFVPTEDSNGEKQRIDDARCFFSVKKCAGLRGTLRPK